MDERIRSEQHHKEAQARAMFSKASILALVAAASIGATLVNSTASADARGNGGGFSRGGGAHFGGFRTNSRHSGLRFHHRPHWHHHHHRRHWYVRWHRPWIYGVGAAASAQPREPMPTK
jgi:hypothetical protein